jgi:MFS family permease
MVYNSFGDSSERESESLNAQNNESNTTLATYSTFTNSQKRLIVFLTAFTSLFSPLSSIIYYPALTFIAQDLNVSLEMMNLTITSYLVISGIAPAFLGDLANTLGRRSIYIGMMMVYVAANIALASQHSYTALVILRMVQSFGSSGEKIKSLLLFNSFLHSEPRANEVSNDCDCVWYCWRYCESSRKRLIYRVGVLRVYFRLRYRGPENQIHIRRPNLASVLGPVLGGWSYNTIPRLAQHLLVPRHSIRLLLHPPSPPLSRNISQYRR